MIHPPVENDFCSPYPLFPWAGFFLGCRLQSFVVISCISAPVISSSCLLCPSPLPTALPVHLPLAHVSRQWRSRLFHYLSLLLSCKLTDRYCVSCSSDPFSSLNWWCFLCVLFLVLVNLPYELPFSIFLVPGWRVLLDGFVVSIA